MSIIGFLKHNKHKKLTLLTYGYTAFYRLLILTVPAHKLERGFGLRGEESAAEESIEVMSRAYRIGRLVERIAGKTPWKSTCLVQSMTARKLLVREKLPCTLYLGVGKAEGKMVAHSWLRCGMVYVTGGNGAGYAIVAKFRN